MIINNVPMMVSTSTKWLLCYLGSHVINYANMAKEKDQTQLKASIWNVNRLKKSTKTWVSIKYMKPKHCIQLQRSSEITSTYYCLVVRLDWRSQQTRKTTLVLEARITDGEFTSRAPFLVQILVKLSKHQVQTRNGIHTKAKTESQDTKTNLWNRRFP